MPKLRGAEAREGSHYAVQSLWPGPAPVQDVSRVLEAGAQSLPAQAEGEAMSVSVTFTIPGREDAAAFKARLNEEAMKRGMSLSEWLVEVIADHLRNQNAKKES